MSETNQEQEDAVMQQMLATKPTLHKPLSSRHDRLAKEKAQGRKPGQLK